MSEGGTGFPVPLSFVSDFHPRARQNEPDAAMGAWE